ncbi:heterokaryon incompatibility protein [Sordaria brevicollis]|uniref:Heterokaryon incompatibility protein n=1 Tax=Sordaria brevicollis TaxID=83679 RepID=A0AAE0UC10_SORBR|nr:heterokaryon incompatibility protein [Sordaria brevicollis]
METNAQGTPFTYDLVLLPDPSTSIRLLELYPSPNFTDDLKCRIYAIPLGETGKYYALSYAWGENKKTHRISTLIPYPLNHASLDLPITASLDICLRHLRDLCPGPTLTIWIDQICINQDSNDEKSHQVRLMKKIYSYAYQVLVWLGPSDEHSDEVMDTWQQVFDMWKEYWNEWSEEWPPNFDDPAQPWLIDLADKTIDLYAHINTPERLGNWQSRDWFGRVWIIQEFCLCDRTAIVCGNKWIPGEAVLVSYDIILYLTLQAFGKCSGGTAKSPTLADRGERWRGVYFDSISRSPPAVLGPFLSLRMRYATSPTRLSLLDLLVQLYASRKRNYHTTRYRDRVYGLLGLASDGDELGIVPDYSCMSTTEVLIQVSRAIIERGRPSPTRGSLPPLSILRYAQLPKFGSEDMDEKVTTRVPLPTWVSAWGHDLTESFEGRFVPDRPYAPCGNSSRAEVIPTSNSNVLGLRGYLVDVIVKTGSRLPRDMADWKEFADSLRQLWLMSYNKKPPVYRTALRHEESLWRIPIGDIVNDKKRAISTDVEEYRRFEQHARDMAQEISCRSLTEKTRTFWSDIILRLRLMTGRRPFPTKQGYLGMCPYHSEPGDLVVVFYGDRVAYVIRPAPPEDGQDRYTLVGEAYCDGIMDGEIADTAEKRDFFLV